MIDQGPPSHVSPYVGANSKCEKKKKKRNKFKRSLCFCCSNVDFENEKDKHKVLEFLENNNNGKTNCVAIFCSNIEVGPKV